MTSEPIRTLLSEIYGRAMAESVSRELVTILDRYKGKIPESTALSLTEQDSILITYPDQVQEPGKPSLASLADFCGAYLEDLINGIHILPFYPWSSDDGFAVIDYESVAPEYGQWSDIGRLGARFKLMFDAVINHTSAESPWFRGFLQGEQSFKDYFIEVKGNPDLSKVVRPRALPLLTTFDSPAGSRHIWTTFSPDQIDLNYHNPAVLLKIMDILLFYASQGAEFVRLDAIAYLWKEPGTSCINLPQTHRIVQLMRAVLDEVAPHVRLITETNVPNLENLSYFGDGTNEAQLVYNFPLPPLVLHALQTGNARVLSKWAATLQLPSERVAFLNFLASHDGIGLNPLRGLLPESEIDALVQRIAAAGGYISKKTNANGTESPYELNVNYFDALNASDSGEGPDAQLKRFLTAHAILLAFMGIPGIYFHSLFGSRGWPEGVRQTKKFRAINREKLMREDLERELADPGSQRARIFQGLARLLRARAGNPCFSPEVSQRVLEAPDSVFALLREKPGTRKGVLCLHNVSQQKQDVRLRLSDTALAASSELRDLITGTPISGGDVVSLVLAPYESVWLEN